MAGTILCVDSDRSLTEIIASALSGQGYSVSTAADGEQAVHLVALEAQFDVDGPIPEMHHRVHEVAFTLSQVLLFDRLLSTHP